jgi:hypothetical protein
MHNLFGYIALYASISSFHYAGNSNYNTYNGADNYGPNGLENNGVGANRPNGGDALASFGLGGLSKLFSLNQMYLLHLF